LTKFGGGDVRLSGDNRGTLTGSVTISGNNWFRLNNLNALGGSLTNPYQKGNDVYLNGGNLFGNCERLLQQRCVREHGRPRRGQQLHVQQPDDQRVCGESERHADGVQCAQLQ
jgi:hypothetical protein